VQKHGKTTNLWLTSIIAKRVAFVEEKTRLFPVIFGASAQIVGCQESAKNKSQHNRVTQMLHLRFMFFATTSMPTMT
jgi:hypothetical protein